MFSKILPTLIVTGALMFAACAPASSADTRHADIELHLGDDAPDKANAGQRAWTTPDGRTVHLTHALTIPGKDIRSIKVDADPMPVLNVVLEPAGGAQLEALTGAHVGKLIGIVANGELLWTATIRGEFGARFQLTAISEAEARAMLQRLIVPAEE